MNPNQHIMKKPENEARMKITKLHCLLILGILMVILMNGCAPTIRQISDDAIETEAVLNARDEGRQQGRQEGINLCRLEMDERLRDFIRKYRDQLLYLELVKGGAILPAQVRLVYNPANISRDGSSLLGAEPDMEDRFTTSVYQ